MKSVISSFDLHILAKELNTLLERAKIQQIYLLENKQLLMDFYVPSKGKTMIIFNVPENLYRIENKPKTPQTPHGFVTYLRKYTKNARIKEVKQLEFERILQITIEAKEKTFHLILEFIPPGNIILCSEEDMILSPLETQNWKDRTIRGKTPYIFPKKEHNILTIKETELAEVIKASDKDSLVKILAIDLGLGGAYAELLCNKAKINKDKKRVTKEDTKALFKAFQAIKKQKIKPSITENKEILPFSAKKASHETFLEAISSVLAPVIEKKKEEKNEAKFSKKVNKHQKIIDMQMKQKEKVLQGYEDNSKKGEAIYNNYQIVKDILDQLKEARKTMSWKDIKKKLKGHAIIKQINEKNNEIVIEL